MALFVRPLTLFEQKQLENFTRFSTNPSLFKRVNVILLSSHRIKSGEIALQLELNRSTVVNWIKRFNREGLSCLEANFLHTERMIEPESQPLFARSLSPDETEALQKLMNRYYERTQTLKRLQCIVLSSQQIPVSQLCQTLGLSQKTARLWIKQFNNLGIEALETASDRQWLARREIAITK